MSARSKFMFALFLAGIGELIIYIFLHEGGHALVAIACGAKITSFSIIGAHTGSIGGTFTDLTSSLRHISGALFPLIIAVCYMLFIFRRDKQGNFYRLFSLFFSLAPAMSLLAWILIPITYMAGHHASDDIISLLETSGINPFIVMIVSLLLFGFYILLAWKKGIVQIWLDVARGKWK